jgi:catechol 2,3-dioxygenase-like lactoylglutathione lyase family enzyme
LKVERTDFVSVPVTDLDRSARFYGETLGLEGRGVVFAGDTHDSGVCHMAFFHDPDGNSLMLHRRYATGS